VDEALEAATGSEEVVIIGGAELYGQFLPRADRLYLTFIDQEFSGDTYFPEFDMSQWDEVLNETVEPAGDVTLSYRFVILERRTR
jgi:dihydrofolate reductase